MGATFAGPSFWTRLEALTANTEFWSGVLVARLLEGMKFAVGPTMALRRDYLDKIGGFRATGEYLAEDFVLGQWAERNGYRVTLATHVVDHCIGSQSFWPNLKHRIRWARSTRRSRPAGVLDDASKLKFVIDLPVDLDALDATVRRAVDRFLKVAKHMGGDQGYIASHRKAWWSVGLRAPAPIISTYMARRPPAFAVNRADARLINIAHGLYPRDPMSVQAQKTLVRYMQTNISQRSGRTYAGGLTKFEPREMERLIVPGPAMLAAGVVQ